MRSFLVILALVLGVYVGYLGYGRFHQVINSEVGRTFGLKKVKVIRGDQFDMLLENDSRVLARLSVHAADESKSKVLVLLRHCENPRVRLMGKQADGQWVVNFLFDQGGKEVDLSSWLIANGLVFK